MACRYVQADIVCYVDENSAHFNTEACFPKVCFAAEYLLKILVFEMFEILLCKRVQDEFCSWSCEQAHAVLVVLDDVVAKKNRDLYAVGS